MSLKGGRILEKHRNMSYAGYYLRYLFLYIVIILTYINVLYIDIPGVEDNVSKDIFVIVPIVIFLLFSFITPPKKRSNFIVIVDSFLAFVPYFLITYYPNYSNYINVFIILGGVISAVFLGSIFLRKIKNEADASRIMKNRTRFALNGVRCIAGVLSFVLLFSAYAGKILNIAFVPNNPPVISSDNKEDEEWWTIKNNIDTVKKLREEEWSNLSVAEKTDVLLVIKNIEINYLGIPHDVNIIVKDLDDNLWGTYDHTEHAITIDEEHVRTDKAKECLHTICHEMYHVYQHNQIEAYNTVDKKYQHMLMFSSARVYEEEFRNYISSEEDLEGYMEQKSEIYADQYADNAIKDYYEKIELYLNEEQTSVKESNQ